MQQQQPGQPGQQKQQQQRSRLVNEWLVVWTLLFAWALYGVGTAGSIVSGALSLWLCSNAALMLASMVQAWLEPHATWDFIVSCLVKCPRTGHRPLWVAAFLAPITAVHTCFMWGMVHTLFRSDAVATNIPHTRIWVANQVRWCSAATTSRLLPSTILVDVTTETGLEPGLAGAVHAVVSLPCLDNCLPNEEALSKAIRTTLECADRMDCPIIVVMCMYGHSRSAAVASVLAAIMAPNTYPTWQHACRALQEKRSRVYIAAAHHETLTHVHAHFSS
jgi:hypothetical protein